MVGNVHSIAVGAHGGAAHSIRLDEIMTSSHQFLWTRFCGASSTCTLYSYENYLDSYLDIIY